MSPSVQFVKCFACVILYIAVCLILLELKKRLHTLNVILTNNDSRSKEACQRVPPTTTLPYVESTQFETKLLEYGELNDESIDLQEVTASLKRVSDTCLKYNLTTPLIRRHFLYNSEHKSLYCWIRKIASNSFTKLYSDMKKGHHQATNDYYKEINSLAPGSPNVLECLKDREGLFKLLIVRHPFERLVSAYRDRLEDNNKYTAQAWIYARKIFRLTRPELFRSNATTGTSLQRMFTFDRRLKLIPTFKEFVTWLLLQSPTQDDVHWDLYYTHCGVCNISYNFILKLDDYTLEQVHYILSRFGLDRSKSYLPVLQRSRGGSTDTYETCKHLKTLSRHTILQLYERQKIDFEMYNYDLVRYANCINVTF